MQSKTSCTRMLIVLAHLLVVSITYWPHRSMLNCWWCSLAVLYIPWNLQKTALSHDSPPPRWLPSKGWATDSYLQSRLRYGCNQALLTTAGRGRRTGERDAPLTMRVVGWPPELLGTFRGACTWWRLNKEFCQKLLIASSILFNQLTS